MSLKRNLVIGGLVVSTLAAASLDLRVRKAFSDYFMPTEETAQNQGLDQESIESRMNKSAWSDGDPYVSFYPQNLRHNGNEQPYKAGQTAILSLYMDSDQRAKSLVLYEDNHPIKISNESILKDEDSKYFEIKRAKGEHSYHLGVFNGNKQEYRSAPFRVIFSGEPEDLAPSISNIYHSVVGEDFLAVTYFVEDTGDNPGIVSGGLYDNGNQIKTIRDIGLDPSQAGGNSFLISNLSPGKHSMFLRIKDKGGNMADSEIFEFDFGPNLPMQIEKLK